MRAFIRQWDGMPMSYDKWKEPKGSSAHLGLLATGRRNEPGSRIVILNGRLGSRWQCLTGSWYCMEPSC